MRAPLSATALSEHVYVFAPVHPGFDGTPRPESTEIGKLSFADAAFRPDFASFTAEQRAAAGANQKALATYAGQAFTHDPKLRGRLHRVTVPVLVAWGEQDGIAGVKYGEAYANSFPDGHFAAIPEAGHFPQIEQTGRTLGAIGDFVDTVVKPSIAD